MQITQTPRSFHCPQWFDSINRSIAPTIPLSVQFHHTMHNAGKELWCYVRVCVFVGVCGGEGVDAVYQENVVPAVLTERRRVAEAVGVAQRQQWPAIVLRRNNVNVDGDSDTDCSSDRNSNDDAAMFAVAVVSVCPQSLPKRRGVNGGSPFGADRLPKHKNNFVTRFHYHCVCVFTRSFVLYTLHSLPTTLHSSLFSASLNLLL